MNREEKMSGGDQQKTGPLKTTFEKPKRQRLASIVTSQPKP